MAEQASNIASSEEAPTAEGAISAAVSAEATTTAMAAPSELQKTDSHSNSRSIPTTALSTAASASSKPAPSLNDANLPHASTSLSPIHVESTASLGAFSEMATPKSLSDRKSKVLEMRLRTVGDILKRQQELSSRLFTYCSEMSRWSLECQAALAAHNISIGPPPTLGPLNFPSGAAAAKSADAATTVPSFTTPRHGQPAFVPHNGSTGVDPAPQLPGRLAGLSSVHTPGSFGNAGSVIMGLLRNPSADSLGGIRDTRPLEPYQAQLLRHSTGGVTYHKNLETGMLPGSMAAGNYGNGSFGHAPDWECDSENDDFGAMRSRDQLNVTQENLYYPSYDGSSSLAKPPSFRRGSPRRFQYPMTRPKPPSSPLSGAEIGSKKVATPNPVDVVTAGSPGTADTDSASQKASKEEKAHKETTENEVKTDSVKGCIVESGLQSVTT